MALQNLPPVAIEYAAVQRRENAAAVAAVRRLWLRVGDDFTPGFLNVAPQIFEVMNTAQVRISENAQAFIPQILAATDQAKSDRPTFDVKATAFMGVAGDGMPTESLAYGAVIRAKDAVGKGSTALQARVAGAKYLSLAVGTMLSDTRRGMEGLESASRPLTGYVRMLTPPSCGRCVILAGKHFKSRQAFLRHPGCDCVNIPSAESIAGSMTVNTDSYFGSLSDDELAKALGSKANAQVYREFGADSRQLVNAYRKSGDVRPAQITRSLIVDGKPVLSRLTVKSTIEGITTRSYAYSQMSRVRALSQTAKQGGRYRQVTAPRLMPESVLSLGLSRERTAQMLRDFGWI